MSEGYRFTIEIETGSTVLELRALLAALPGDAQVRGSVVVWQNGEPSKIIALAPEYDGE